MEAGRPRLGLERNFALIDAKDNGVKTPWISKMNNAILIFGLNGLQ